MAGVDKTLLLKLLELVSRPVVRFCLRHSLKLYDIQSVLKKEFVRAAAEELRSKGLKENLSRISVMTGVHRRDLMKFRLGEDVGREEKDLVSRVMGQWRSAEPFVTKAGEPRVLSYSGEDSEFAQLCKSVSLDINPGTILFELQRVGAVTYAKNGLRLIHKSYVPVGDPVAGFSILADDTETLLYSVEENVFEESPVPHLHVRTSYDNVRPEALLEIKRWMLKHGHEAHNQARRFISQFDQDVNPDPKFKGKGIKVVFTAFSNVESKKGKK